MKIRFDIKVYMPIMACIILLLAIAIVLDIDKKASKDVLKEYKTHDSEQERIEREYIPVSLTTFRNLIKSYKDIYHDDLEHMNMPKFNSETQNVTINAQGKTARKTITGCDDKTEFEWYQSQGTMMSFKASIIEGDTIVSCPALLLVRLVENYEKNVNSNR